MEHRPTAPAAIAVDPDRFAAVDAGDALRARIHYLVAQNHALIGQTQFADAKAAALMTLVGLVALRGPLLEQAAVGPGLFQDPLGLTAFAAMAVCMMLCLWAIIPRFPTARERKSLMTHDRYSWPSLSGPGWTAESYAAFVREGDFAELIASIASSNLFGSRILAKKFRTMRLAFYFAFGAIFLMALRAVV